MKRQQSREAVLCEQPELLGQTWATEWVHTLQSEGRPVSGGWPGTLPEARMRAQEHLDRELTSRKMPLLSKDELRQVTALVYERAKTEWWLAVRKG